MSHKDQIVPGEPFLANQISSDSRTVGAISSRRLFPPCSGSQTGADGHWCGDVWTNAAITAEHIFLCQAISIDLSADREAFITWLLSSQGADGGWNTDPGSPGDISITVEVYLALKILGVPQLHEQMRNARSFVISAGGVAKVRVLTRVWLATFGLFPWSDLPMLFPESVLLLLLLPFSARRWSGWAQAVLIPLSVVAHHRPTYNLPSGETPSSEYLDELWCDPDDKMIPRTFKRWKHWSRRPFISMFILANSVMRRLDGLKLYNPIRQYALWKCTNWITRHQDDLGGVSGTVLPLHGAVLALSAHGYPLHSKFIREGLDAIGHFSYCNHRGKRIQTMASVCWDNGNRATSLNDTDITPKDWQYKLPLPWVRLRKRGWKVNDIAAAVVTMIRQDPQSTSSFFISDALHWLLRTQRRDGGWDALYYSNNSSNNNVSPGTVSNIESVVSSSSDVTGHVLEAFGLSLKISKQQHSWASMTELCDLLTTASQRAIYFLSAMQKPSGAWCGSRDINYIYGTTVVLRAVSYFIGSKQHSEWIERDDSIHDDICLAIQWLETVQNQDGGWGEDLQSSGDLLRTGPSPSTVSHTASALVALLSYLPPSVASIQRGVEYLLRQENRIDSEGASDSESSKILTREDLNVIDVFGSLTNCQLRGLREMDRNTAIIVTMTMKSSSEGSSIPGKSRPR